MRFVTFAECCRLQLGAFTNPFAAARLIFLPVFITQISFQENQLDMPQQQRALFMIQDISLPLSGPFVIYHS
jgi:hypothetical protein